MLEKIRAALVENIGVEPEEVTLNARLKDDLGADSLDLMELITGIEDEYGVEFPAEELEELGEGTVGDVVNYLAENGIK